jgi:poly(rC)-binding protein 2/3/4
MSASPSQTTNPAKRPLEDASSPSAKNDQPEAKRPALDKVIKNGHDEENLVVESEDNAVTPPPESNGTVKAEDTNGEKTEAKDEQGDIIVPDVSESKATSNAIATAATAAAIPPSTNTHDETAWIHIRAVISSPEAATIIGKGGENVSNIRKQSGAKCTVSDYQKGAVERILTVSGVVDAVAKVSLIRFHRKLSYILTSSGVRFDNSNTQ